MTTRSGDRGILNIFQESTVCCQILFALSLPSLSLFEVLPNTTAPHLDMKVRLSICLLIALLTTVVLADDPKAARPSMDTSARIERRQPPATGDRPARQHVIVDTSDRQVSFQNRMRLQRFKAGGRKDLLFTLQSMQGLQPVVAKVRADGDDSEKHDENHSASIKNATLGAHRDVSCGAKDADPKW